MGDCACDVSLAQLDPNTALSVVYLELTPSCKNACPGCGNVFLHDDAAPPLSAAEWARVLDRLAPYRPKLRLTGGEPTLHPEFAQIVHHVQGMGFPFSVFSNARWQDPGRMLRVLGNLTGLECVLVSLHGARPESHEAFTSTPGSFVETVVNVRRATNAGISVNTSTVITHHNYFEIPDIISLSQRLGAGQAVFNRYIGRPLPRLEASDRELKTAIAAVERAGHNGSSGRVKFGTPIPQCFTPNSSNGCMAGFVHATIDPWGNLRPCPHVPTVAGNVLRQNFEEIWHSPTMEDWRRGLLAQCDGCSLVGGCRSGCQAQAIWQGNGHDPLNLPGLVSTPRGRKALTL